jgi:hypothetical protein
MSPRSAIANSTVSMLTVRYRLRSQVGLGQRRGLVRARQPARHHGAVLAGHAAGLLVQAGDE